MTGTVLSPLGVAPLLEVPRVGEVRREETVVRVPFTGRAIRCLREGLASRE